MYEISRSEWVYYMQLPTNELSQKTNYTSIRKVQHGSQIGEHDS